MEAAEGLLQLLQEQPNNDGLESYHDFEVLVNRPTTLNLCDCSCDNEATNETENLSTIQLPDDDIEAAEDLLQLLQEQPNYNGPKTYGEFQVQVNTPKLSTLCDLLTTDSALTSFTGISTLHLLETIVKAVQCHYVDQRSHRLSCNAIL